MSIMIERWFAVVRAHTPVLGQSLPPPASPVRDDAICFTLASAIVRSSVTSRPGRGRANTSAIGHTGARRAMRKKAMGASSEMLRRT